MADGFSTLRALWALREDRTLDPATWKVAVALLMFANEQGVSFPSLSRLAETARTSRSAVRRALAVLEQHTGPVQLRVERARRTAHGDADSNRYVLVLNVGCDQPDPTCVQGDPTCDQPDPGVVPAKPHGCDQPDPGGVTSQTPEEDTGRGQSKRTPKGTSSARSARWRRCPESWKPNEQHEQLARERGVDLALELAKFRDHDFSAPKADPDATFRNWLRSAKPNRPTVSNAGGTRAGDLIGLQHQRIRDLQAQEQGGRALR